MDNIRLARTIKILCKSKKITVKSLLENCKINRNFMYDLEKKAQTPSADKLEAIADYLDCSVDYLLGRTDNPEINK
ncbi:MAG: helix-turn-helix transcriptional regulator [Eubacteriales bacterium]|nr:helix-turn-helix transcriptional regulator [Eubacteriales bacterium]